jgi:hypothetical protein
MSDMLDVLHFFFEEDSTSMSSAEQVEARDSVRENLYSTLYKTTYKYSQSKSRAVANPEDLPFEDEEPLPKPFDPLEVNKPPKPFKRATDFDPDSALPFGSVLDAPLK